MVQAAGECIRATHEATRLVEQGKIEPGQYSKFLWSVQISTGVLRAFEESQSQADVNGSVPHSSTAFPAPSSPPNHAISILVYGAGSTTGQYTLHAAGHTNVLATASLKHHAFLCTLSATLTVDVARAVGGDGKVALTLKAITVEGTLVRIAEVLSVQGTLTLLLPIKAGEAPMHWEVLVERNPFPASMTSKYVRTFMYVEDNLMPKLLPELLASGLIQLNRCDCWTRGPGAISRLRMSSTLHDMHSLAACRWCADTVHAGLPPPHIAYPLPSLVR
ncbi:hypothetical protein B0H14DRAFT_3685122 [Mycena olivaceomarginata]|nr:hypothetical protein B0H14DRAFT_3685122 [Mycena olivaceomarginata]